MFGRKPDSWCTMHLPRQQDPHAARYCYMVRLTTYYDWEGKGNLSRLQECCKAVIVVIESGGTLRPVTHQKISIQISTRLISRLY